MKTKGVRILDLKHGKCIPLYDLLKLIPSEIGFFWALLWFDVTPLKNKERKLAVLQKKANQSESGLIIAFESLLELSRDVFQEIDLTIIACKEKKNIRRYKDDREMYETCDIVVEMIDGGF